MCENKERIIAIHVTDLRIYNKFDYVLKVQINLRLDVTDDSKLIKDILYIGDYLNRMKVSH
jgi:hypothetical protein